VGDLVALHAADAVLGADRAVQLAEDAADDIIELLPARQIGFGVGAVRLGQVEVDIAVADRAEGDRADA
jgi:hypothetical protein